MRVILSFPLAALMALVSPHEEAKKEAGGSTGNVIIRRASVSEPGELEAFLRMNPEEQFDIEALNSMDWHALVEEAREDKRLLRDVVRAAEALLPRVRADTEDPVLAGAILRNKTLDWYRKSSSDPSWPERMPVRWGGIFHESRVPGGRLSRKLSTRLVNLINECVNASGTAEVLRVGFAGLFRGSAVVKSMVQFGLGSKRPRLTQQVSQAYLDDLAANPRNGDQPVPLERLSEVAGRTGSAEANITLSELFHHSDTRSFIVLDQRFRPGMNDIAIRVVPARNSEEASTYDLVLATRMPESGNASDATTEAVPSSPWERQDLTGRDWLDLLLSLQKRKVKLDPPPREHSRDRESYLGLRNLVMSDASAREAFLAVRWKGKPSGLPLLCRILSEGTWEPEVETDGDYLEAELDHLDREHAAGRSKDGQWKIGHGWTVVREIGAGSVRTYRARATPSD